MKINIGSKNKVKIEAVRELIQDYDLFSKAEIIPQSANSEVAEQPKSLTETIAGAKNRAKNAFNDCDYSFGIEDGLMHVPGAKTDYMNITACAIYDGKDYHLGLSPAFEYPPKITKLVLEKGLDINQAFYQTKLSENPQVGSAEGAVGILTKGRLPRKECIKQAVMMALIQIENAGLFTR